ncbi:IS630 family transposase [Salinibaculum rarum]|uniref:IS630 family transposase n=1 Tax=Salinibaculum rarum TaxID=3058903 RepID=UPI00265FF719|nr:IS630 family transposase [Salinibaculum sp. KK48]
MSPGPSPTAITLTAQDQTDLEAVIRKATSPQRDVFRARVILLAANGANNTDIATQLDCTRKTVRKWRDRFADAGRAGLADASRPGRPPIYDQSVRALITALACELPAERQLPLSRLSTADIHVQAGQELDRCPSRSTIAAWLKQAAIKPWTYASWVTPRDPQFEQKSAPVLDLYNGLWQGEELTEGDVIICADEKTGIQARSRRRTPPGPGTPGHVEHQYERHGTCTYQAALLVGTGEILGQCVERNTRANFETLVEEVMEHPICRRADRVFWITDNGGAHHPNTFTWWLKKQYDNIEGLHLPTGASWLNQIELYFSVLARKALTGGSFDSIRELMHQIAGFEVLWNEVPEPFEWTYTRQDMEKLLERVPEIE